jgi:hypothetical protein
MDHPLQPIRARVNGALGRLSRDFAQLHAKTGRPSIPSEHLLRGLLLQAGFLIRSEQALIKQLSYRPISSVTLAPASVGLFVPTRPRSCRFAADVRGP